MAVGGVASRVGHLGGYFKYLGIYMSPLGSLKHEVGKLRSEVMGIFDVLDRKRLSTREVVYIVNSVVAGKMQYAMQTTGLPRKFLQEVDARSARVVKLSLKVGTRAPPHIVFCKRYGVGVVNMVDLQDAVSISEEVIRLNSSGIAGGVAKVDG